MLTATQEPTVAMGCLEFVTRRQVTPDDVKRVVELACRVQLPEGGKLLHAEVTYFTVDDVHTLNPVGQVCERLSACMALLA